MNNSLKGSHNGSDVPSSWVSLIGIIAVLTMLFCLLLPWLNRPSQRRPFARVAQHDLRELTVAIDAYYIEYASSPSGSNADVVRTLFGDNPKKIVFFEARPAAISKTGAFLDPWGNTLILWTKGGDEPQIPEGWTRE